MHADSLPADGERRRLGKRSRFKLCWPLCPYFVRVRARARAHVCVCVCRAALRAHPQVFQEVTRRLAGPLNSPVTLGFARAQPAAGPTYYEVTLRRVRERGSMSECVCTCQGGCACAHSSVARV